MRTYAKAKAVMLTMGLALLALGSMSPSAFAPPPGPPGPPPPLCEVISVSIHGPSKGTVGESSTFQGEAETQHCSDEPRYSWALRSSPEGAEPWVATGREVSYTPRIAGEYILKLKVTVDGTGKGSARHRFIAVASQPGEIQEFALILGPGSELRTFPAALRVSAGSLRLFLTSLDHAVTIVIRREGAQAGISTALVEPVKLTILEIELAQGVYEIVPQGEDVVLGRIEAR